jgi:hypothetical protein
LGVFFWHTQHHCSTIFAADWSCSCCCFDESALLDFIFVGKTNFFVCRQANLLYVAPFCYYWFEGFPISFRLNASCILTMTISRKMSSQWSEMAQTADKWEVAFMLRGNNTTAANSAAHKSLPVTW